MPMLIEPKPVRYQTEQTANGLCVSIPPARKRFILFFLPLWLLGWGFGWVHVGHDIWIGKSRDLFTLVWFVAWTGFGILFGGYWLWMVFGRENLLISVDRFQIRRAILGIGWSRTFRPSEIRNTRFQPDLSAGRRYEPSAIVFDYGARTYKFARGLDDAEADQLISLIIQRIPSAATSSEREKKKLFWTID